MSTKRKSNITFLILLAILALAAGLNYFLPQGEIATQMLQSQIPKWQLALGGAGITFVLYGLLGFIGLALWRKLGVSGYLGRTGYQSAAVPDAGRV